MRFRVAAVFVAVLFASWSVSMSAQRTPGFASRALKVLGAFAWSVAVDTAADVTKDQLMGFVQRAQPLPVGSQRCDPQSTECGYRFTLQWNDPRDATVTYNGILTILGKAGSFRVTMSYSGRPIAIIAQIMSARPASDRRGDVELFPISAVFEERSSLDIAYAADTFWLTPLPSGEWTIKDTCDGRACAPVNVMSADEMVADRYRR